MALTATAECAWQTDCVATVNAAISTTGGVVWSAARELAAFLAKDSSVAGPYAARLGRGRRVLELGAGCGWLGMAIAHNSPDIELVCVTERAEGGGLVHLERNIAENASSSSGSDGARVHAVASAECDWQTCGEGPGLQLRRLRAAGATGAAAAADGADEFAENSGQVAPADSWDLLVGSDLVYVQDPAGLTHLPRLLRALLVASEARGCICLYAHTKRRYEFLDNDFYDALAAVGLRVREVAPGGGPIPDEAHPGTPRPLAERIEEEDFALFEEQRVAILEISLAAPDESPEPYR